MNEGEVMVKCFLTVIKRGRKSSSSEEWTCQIKKKATWTLADFRPFMIEESGETWFGPYRRRYFLEIEAQNPITNELFCKPYAVPMSKYEQIERCLLGNGWERGFTRKAGDS